MQNSNRPVRLGIASVILGYMLTRFPALRRMWRTRSVASIIVSVIVWYLSRTNQAEEETISAKEPTPVKQPTPVNGSKSH